MTQSTTSPLQRIKRHTLWLLVAFFVALSYFSIRNLGEKLEERDNARMIRTWTGTSVAFSQLIHELQKERGMSSGFIASYGSKFKRELPEQRTLTGQAIARLTEATRALPVEAETLAVLSRGSLAEIESLSGLRQQISELRLSRDVTVDRYNELIAHMFDHLLTTMSVGRVGWIVRQQMAFIFFLQANEMAGQERALVTAILTARDFSAAPMAAFHRIKAVEHSSIEKFLQLADAEAKAGYRKIMERPYIADGEGIRRLVVAVGASREPLQIKMPSPETWFSLATDKIDAMSHFEVIVSNRLISSANDIEAQAQHALAINAIAVLVSFILAGVLFFLIWRGKEIAEKNLYLAAEVFDNSVESIIITDTDANIVKVNPAFCRVTGYTLEEVIGKNPRIFKSGRHDQKFYEAMWERLLSTGSWEGEIWNRYKNGSIYTTLLSISAVKSQKGETKNYIAMMLDLSKFKETEALLEKLRTFDPLTGLLNRDAWQSAVDQALARSQLSSSKFVVLDIRLDRFKQINESLGHAVGDEVLVAASELIKLVLRHGDVAARPSGNHFAILLHDHNNPGDVGTYCERLLAAFSPPIAVRDKSLSLSISIGIALFPADGETPCTLLQNAESALHAAIDKGGACYTFYSAEMNAAGTKLLALEQMMRYALERNEFSVVFQPQVDAATGYLLGVEALLRWSNPELGMVSPVQFIPIAETNGMIVPIGNWVLRQSCRQAQHWRQEFGVDIPVAVNLSARQFRREDLMSSVTLALDDSGLPSRLLELEITEGLLMNDPAGATVIMQGLRCMGIKLALDDFGTGYSSLAYLKTFPLDRLKLDRAFVIDLPTNSYDQAIAQSVISLGHVLNMDVLAEGVETEAQRDYLIALGCDVFQGYLYGKPMTPDQLEEDIRAGRLLLQHDNFSRAPQIELADSGQWRTHTADPQATLDLQKKPPEVRHS